MVNVYLNSKKVINDIIKIALDENLTYKSDRKMSDINH